MSPVVFIILSGSLVALLSAEVVVSAVAQKRLYGFAFTLQNFSLVVGNLAVSAILRVGPFLAYPVVYEHLRLTTLDASWPAFVLALLGTDFLFYWQHRWSHRIRILWAIHEVHHQSEELNLSTAFRVPALQDVVATVSFLPVALLGVPVSVFSAAYFIWIVWGTLTHTQLVARLGPLESVLVTPSHHRVHHARDEVYLDRNFGQMFIMFDKWFGTFAPERTAPRFGIGGWSATYNPIRANLDPWRRLVREFVHAPSLRWRLRTLFGSPAWSPPFVPEETEVPIFPTTRRQRATALALFLVSAGVAFTLVGGNAALPWTAKLGLFALTAAGLYLTGRALDGRPILGRQVVTIGHLPHPRGAGGTG